MKKQQGDVIIRATVEIPEGARKVERKSRGFVLAEGEATGHAHIIDDDIEMYEKDGVLYIKTDKQVRVTHDEHKPISLDPGIYRVGRVREFDPFSEAAARRVRAVRD